MNNRCVIMFEISEENSTFCASIGERGWPAQPSLSAPCRPERRFSGSSGKRPGGSGHTEIPLAIELFRDIILPSRSPRLIHRVRSPLLHPLVVLLLKPPAVVVIKYASLQSLLIRSPTVVNLGQEVLAVYCLPIASYTSYGQFCNLISRGRPSPQIMIGNISHHHGMGID